MSGRENLDENKEDAPLQAAVGLQVPVLSRIMRRKDRPHSLVRSPSGTDMASPARVGPYHNMR